MFKKILTLVICTLSILNTNAQPTKQEDLGKKMITNTSRAPA